MSNSTLGKELISAITDALENKESGRVVMPHVDVAKLDTTSFQRLAN